MKIIEVQLNDISPNDYNPNHMDADKMDKLVSTIKNRGYLQYIVVRNAPEAGKYIIVDGEHRWTALKQLPEYSLVPVPVILVENIDDDLAKIDTINFNIIHGHMNARKIGKILEELQEDFDTQELLNLISYSEEEVTDYITFANLPVNLEEVKNTLDTDMEEDTTLSPAIEREIKITVSHAEERLYVHTRLQLEEGGVSDEEFLAKLSQSFLEKTTL